MLPLAAGIYSENTYISVTEVSILTKFGLSVKTSIWSKTFSQNFDICLSFYFMQRNGKLFF